MENSQNKRKSKIPSFCCKSSPTLEFSAMFHFVCRKFWVRTAHCIANFMKTRVLTPDQNFHWKLSYAKCCTDSKYYSQSCESYLSTGNPSEILEHTSVYWICFIHTQTTDHDIFLFLWLEFSRMWKHLILIAYLPDKREKIDSLRIWNDFFTFEKKKYFTKNNNNKME